jgi:hypothetical protein
MHLNPIKIHIQCLWSEKTKSVLRVMMLHRDRPWRQGWGDSRLQLLK